jgi:hypothetical protein
MAELCIPVVAQNGDHRGWMIECPACECAHYFDQRWEFNGNREAPTFRPSMLSNGNPKYHNPTKPRCHSFVTNGEIQFLGDCSHGMAGQTVKLQPFTKK